MSREQLDAFLERRARVLKKHAEQDPEWQAYQRARRPRPLGLIFGTLMALGVLGAVGKSVLIAYHGPSGYAAVVAPLAGAVADIPYVSDLIAPDPVTLAVAGLIAPSSRGSAQVATALQAEPSAESGAGAD